MRGLALVVDGQLLHINVQRFRGGLVFKAHRHCASLNSRLESNKEEEKGRAPPRNPNRPALPFTGLTREQGVTGVPRS